MNPSPIVINGMCPLPTARVGSPYSQRFTATGGVAPYQFRLDGSLPAGLELASDGTVKGTPQAPNQSSFEVEVTDATGRSVPKACSIQASLPELPSFRLAAFPATLAPASNGPVVTFELGNPYTLPIEGEFVISNEADTGSLDPAVDRPDPRVRFANGMQNLRFTIPPGTTQVSAPIVSTGTVAALVTVRAVDVSVSGVKILTPPAPRQSRIARAIPVMTDACLATSATGAELRITGYTTTRSLLRAEFTYTAGTQQVTSKIHVSGSAADYFHSDEAVRSGGAFTLSMPLIMEVPARCSRRVSR